MVTRGVCLVLSMMLSLPTLVFAKENCEKKMLGSYYVVPYSEPSGIHMTAINLISDDPMNGKPVFRVEKRGGELVHIGSVSGNVFDTDSDDMAEDNNLFNGILGSGTTRCGYEVDGNSDIKVFYVDLKKADKKKVKELYGYAMEIWERSSSHADTSRFRTKVAKRKMTLKEFTNTSYFLYNLYSDGTIGVAFLVPLEKK